MLECSAHHRCSCVNLSSGQAADFALGDQQLTRNCGKCADAREMANFGQEMPVSTGKAEDAVNGFKVIFRYGIAIAVLAGSYYMLVLLVFDRLPFPSPPTWWIAAWPSRGLGWFLWGEVLNVAGTIIAAFPVSLVVRFVVSARRLRAAFLSAAITALVVLVKLFAGDLSPITSSSSAPRFWLWLDTAILTSALCCSLPLLYWIVRKLPPYVRLDRLHS
jgi:hypothetical protein